MVGGQGASRSNSRFHAFIWLMNAPFFRYFSSATSTPSSQRTLASNLLNLYNQYSLDGIDIDWEYPAQQGDKSNVVSSSDTAHYLSFLKLLRRTLPAGAKITAAATTVPWAGPDGAPMKDMSEFAKVLDWVLIMNYDTWGCTHFLLPFHPSLVLKIISPRCSFVETRSKRCT